MYTSLFPERNFATCSKTKFVQVNLIKIIFVVVKEMFPKRLWISLNNLTTLLFYNTLKFATGNISLKSGSKKLPSFSAIIKSLNAN